MFSRTEKLAPVQRLHKAAYDTLVLTGVPILSHTALIRPILSQRSIGTRLPPMDHSGNPISLREQGSRGRRKLFSVWIFADYANDKIEETPAGN